MYYIDVGCIGSLGASLYHGFMSLVDRFLQPIILKAPYNFILCPEIGCAQSHMYKIMVIITFLMESFYI